MLFWGYSFCVFWIHAQDIILKCGKVETPYYLHPGSPIIYILPDLLSYSLPLSLCTSFPETRPFCRWENWGLGVTSGAYLRGPTLEARNLRSTNLARAYRDIWNLNSQADRPQNIKRQLQIQNWCVWFNVHNTLKWVNCYSTTLVFRNRKAQITRTQKIIYSS